MSDQTVTGETPEAVPAAEPVTEVSTPEVAATAEASTAAVVETPAVQDAVQAEPVVETPAVQDAVQAEPVVETPAVQDAVQAEPVVETPAAVSADPSTTGVVITHTDHDEATDLAAEVESHIKTAYDDAGAEVHALWARLKELLHL